ncbi:MAG: HlyD family efflux transporter periplasmic adaptor subunit [Planctomycetes bacterium]|nr:HlyD family efflux transporter periplasmic adaptor subunit [Planctomycetota bacterium]
MTKRGKKIIWWTVTIIIVLFVSCQLMHKKSPKQIQTTVRLETIQPGQLQEYVSAPGGIEPKTKVEIIARVSASIQELPFKEGRHVKAGDIVVRLDAKEYESRLKSIEAGYKAQQAQAEVTKSQITVRKAQLKGTTASLEQAKNDYQRQKQLLETHDISQSAFEQAKQKYEEIQSQYESSVEQIRTEELSLVVAQHNLESQKAQIDEAKEALEYTIMRSPIDGVVTRINKEVGEMVTGSMNYSGTLIMTVADLSQMLLVAQVDEADVGKIRVGQETNIRVKAFWDQVYHGKVGYIALVDGEPGNENYNNNNSKSTKYYRTEILIEGDVSKLYTGLTADVDIFTNTHTGVLKVPSQAVVTRKFDDLPPAIRDKNPLVDPNKADVTVVFRQINGKTAATPVKIGPSDTTHIIIEQGLKAGEQIIIGPYKILDSLRHDQAVRDEKEAEAEKKAKDKSAAEKKTPAPKAS